MSPAEIRALTVLAERQPGETPDGYRLRHEAEQRLMSWRLWLPDLLALAERGAADIPNPAETQA